MSPWQTLDTVPLNTEVLLTDGRRCFVGECTVETRHLHAQPSIMVWDGECCWVHATHWAPLPELPEDA